MLWLLFALMGGLSKSLLDLLSKKFMQNKDEYIITWARYAFASPMVLLLLFFIEIPKIDSTFWLAVSITVPLETIAIMMYIRAIKISPLSLTIPMLGMSPIFILLTSYVMLKELPSFKGIIGILVIVCGSYILGMDSNKKEFLAPFKSLIKEKGPMLMLIVAFIYSITPNIGKIGMLHSSVLFFVIIYMPFKAILYFFIVLVKSKENLYQIKENKINFLSLGILAICEYAFILLAFKYALVNYVMSAKRASILFSVIFGFMFFKEKKIKERLLGAFIIIIGIIIISFA